MIKWSGPNFDFCCSSQCNETFLGDDVCCFPIQIAPRMRLLGSIESSERLKNRTEEIEFWNLPGSKEVVCVFWFLSVWKGFGWWLKMFFFLGWRGNLIWPPPPSWLVLVPWPTLDTFIVFLWNNHQSPFFLVREIAKAKDGVFPSLQVNFQHLFLWIKQKRDPPCHQHDSGSWHTKRVPGAPAEYLHDDCEFSGIFATAVIVDRPYPSH